MTKGVRITKTMKAATKAGEGVLSMSQKRKEAWPRGYKTFSMLMKF